MLLLPTGRTWCSAGRPLPTATRLYSTLHCLAYSSKAPGDLRYAQTMSFTTLMLFQIFNVVNARSDERSAFVRLFTNHWLWLAIAGSVLLQVAVVYVPFLQRAFGTTNLIPELT